MENLLKIWKQLKAIIMGLYEYFGWARHILPSLSYVPVSQTRRVNEFRVVYPNVNA